MNIAEITNGFDRPRELMSNLEEFQMESELFQSLKLHIDSQSKLIQLYQSRIRSYERFRKYCHRVARLGDRTTHDKFDLGQFQSEYNRFDKNYCYFRMRIRKLRKETKSSLSTRYQDPYDALHELFTKIESLKKSTNTKKSVDQSSNINNSLSKEKKPEDRPLSVVPISYQTPILILNPIKVNNFSVATPEHIESHIKCFVAGCGRMFASKSFYLNHLYEHSTSVGQNPTTKQTKTIGAKAIERIPARQARSATASTSKVRNVVPKTQSLNNKPAYKVGPKIQSSIATDQKQTNKLPNSEIVSENDTQSQNYNLAENKPPTIFKCDFFGCQYECFERYNLKRHQMRHKDIRPFKCDQCDKSFKHKEGVKTHRVSVHEGRRFPCTEEGCSASLSSKNCLRQHINTYHCKDPNVYRCEGEGCDYKTKNFEALKRHSAVHSDDRPYKCMWPDCGKAFKAYVTRKDHLLMHQNERRYKCKYPDCSYSCNTTNNLRKHHLVHEKRESQKTQMDSDQLDLNLNIEMISNQ